MPLIEEEFGVAAKILVVIAAALIRAAAPAPPRRSNFFIRVSLSYTIQLVKISDHIRPKNYPRGGQVLRKNSGRERRAALFLRRAACFVGGNAGVSRGRTGGSDLQAGLASLITDAGLRG